MAPAKRFNHKDTKEHKDTQRHIERLPPEITVMEWLAITWCGAIHNTY